MGKPIPLPIPPGIVLNRTKLEATGRYVDCDHVRWGRDGQPEKIGGYESWTAQAVGAGCRAILAWQDYNYNQWNAFGTYQRLYVYNVGETRTNITPFDDTGTLANNPFATTNGSAIVTVTHTGHARMPGNYVNFSGASAVGGITISGEYTVFTKVDDDHYTIVHSSSATSTSAGGGGASVAYSYELPAGYLDLTFGGGWGIGTWGTGTWGTIRSSSTYLQLPRNWSLDRYGQYLLAMPTGGALYQWTLNTSNRAAIISTAPTGQYMFVTSERIVVVLGANGDFMAVHTSDDDNNTEWTPDQANTCIQRKLQKGNRLIAGAALTKQSNVIWADTHVYQMLWTGTQTVYAIQVIAEVGLIGPNAFCIVDGAAYWMSTTGFHVLSGSVQMIPNWQNIEDIFQNLSLRQRFKVCCWYNPARNEIWWHYPTANSTEPNAYVMFDLDTLEWAVGTFEDSRTAMFVSNILGEQRIIGTDDLGNIFLHEVGVDADGDALDWHIESGWLDLQNGSMGVDVDGYIPDFERWTGDLTVEIAVRDLPEDATNLDTVQYTLAEGQAIEDMRDHGRMVKLRLSQTNELGGDFALGAHKLEVAGTKIPRKG